MFGEDANDIRALILAQYDDAPDLEVIWFQEIRRSMRAHYKVRIKMAEENIENETKMDDKKFWKRDYRDELKGLQKIWAHLKFDLEGQDEEIHCIKLVNARRKKLGMSCWSPY